MRSVLNALFFLVFGSMVLSSCEICTKDRHVYLRKWDAVKQRNEWVHDEECAECLRIKQEMVRDVARSSNYVWVIYMRY